MVFWDQVTRDLSFPKQLRNAGSLTAMVRFSDVGVRGVQYGFVAFIKAIFTSTVLKYPTLGERDFFQNVKAPNYPQRVAIAK